MIRQFLCTKAEVAGQSDNIARTRLCEVFVKLSLKWRQYCQVAFARVPEPLFIQSGTPFTILMVNMYM